MIREITPFSNSKIPSTSLISRFGIYGIALIFSSALMGYFVGVIGLVFAKLEIINFFYWIILIIVITSLLALIELGTLTIKVPSTGWQVPASWSRFGKAYQALLYGLTLGPGLLTFIPFSTFYVLLLFQASLGIIGSIALGVVYSVSRVSAMFISSTLMNYIDEDTSFLDNILRQFPLLHRLNGIMLLTIVQILFITYLIKK